MKRRALFAHADRIASRGRGRTSGFTVIELLVVLAVLALLLSVAAPRYMHHLDRARDTALRHNLHEMRNAIDQFYSDQGRYPTTLAELVEKRYLRAIPQDPVTQRADTWQTVAPRSGTAEGEGVYDVRSGTKDLAPDGSAYASW